MTWAPLLVKCAKPASVALLLVAMQTQATTHYITSSGAGSKNGSDWNNAYQGIPGTLTRGDTYVIAGGGYGPVNFTTADSGSTAITIRKAQAGTYNGIAYNDDLISGWTSSFQTTQAVFSATGQSAITFTTDYWNLDGVQPANKWAKSGYGIKLNQSSPNQPTHLIDIGQWPTANHGNYVSVKNVDFACPGASYDQEQFDIVFSGGTAGDYVGYNYFESGAQQHIRVFGTQGMVIEYNYISGVSYFSDHHGEQIGLLLESVSSGQQPANTTIRYNWMDDSTTTNTTGSIIDLTNTGDTDNGVYIYGNIFANLTGHNGIGSGNSGSPGSLTNWKFYNNTFINSIVDFSQLSTGSDFTNNLLYGSDAEVFAGSAPATRRNNYWNNSTNGIGSGTNDVVSSESTSILFANYASGDYHLGSGAHARHAGYALASPYNVDPDGNIRGAGGSWDIGAFEYETTNAPSPPTNLTATF